jgi:hypothetical protein
MRWVIILVLLSTVAPAWAQEAPVMNDEQAREAVEAYERVIRRFNTHTESFKSWNAFKTAVISQLPPGVTGNCYEQTSGSMQGVTVTRVKFQPVESDGWKATSGNGWRRLDSDRNFVEYRFNPEAGVVLRVEGVKPRFFFSYTKRICEFPIKK